MAQDYTADFSLAGGFYAESSPTYAVKSAIPMQDQLNTLGLIKVLD